MPYCGPMADVVLYEEVARPYFRPASIPRPKCAHDSSHGMRIIDEVLNMLECLELAVEPLERQLSLVRVGVPTCRDTLSRINVP